MPLPQILYVALPYLKLLNGHDSQILDLSPGCLIRTVHTAFCQLRGLPFSELLLGPVSRLIVQKLLQRHRRGECCKNAPGPGELEKPALSTWEATLQTNPRQQYSSLFGKQSLLL